MRIFFSMFSFGSASELNNKFHLPFERSLIPGGYKIIRFGVSSLNRKLANLYQNVD
ncbi:hypothetical protein SBDP1_570029 [Syntrophobacter sp. SbD1]|nr:hypothetical protein SBDP1_570029 [Syntrophobacter sp. SbD1]